MQQWINGLPLFYNAKAVSLTKSLLTAVSKKLNESFPREDFLLVEIQIQWYLGGNFEIPVSRSKRKQLLVSCVPLNPRELKGCKPWIRIATAKANQWRFERKLLKSVNCLILLSRFQYKEKPWKGNPRGVHDFCGIYSKSFNVGTQHRLSLWKKQWLLNFIFGCSLCVFH